MSNYELANHLENWSHQIAQLCGQEPNRALKLQYEAILKPFFERAKARRAEQEAQNLQDENLGHE